jgi:hypothetical protein
MPLKVIPVLQLKVIAINGMVNERELISVLADLNVAG